MNLKPATDIGRSLISLLLFESVRTTVCSVLALLGGLKFDSKVSKRKRINHLFLISCRCYFKHVSKVSRLIVFQKVKCNLYCCRSER